MQDMIEATEKISKRSNEIGKIIRTIEDICFHTNILTLNAAVEASRAGAEDTREVIKSIDKISSASDEQAGSISQVTQGIDQISSVNSDQFSNCGAKCRCQ